MLLRQVAAPHMTWAHLLQTQTDITGDVDAADGGDDDGASGDAGDDEAVARVPMKRVRLLLRAYSNPVFLVEAMRRVKTRRGARLFALVRGTVACDQSAGGHSL